MKKYEKPSLAVLTISANDSLCACSEKTKDEFIWTAFDENGNGYFDEGDINIGHYFGDGECDSPIIGVCKFTATIDTLFTS